MRFDAPFGSGLIPGVSAIKHIDGIFSSPHFKVITPATPPISPRFKLGMFSFSMDFSISTDHETTYTSFGFSAVIPSRFTMIFGFKSETHFNISSVNSPTTIGGIKTSEYITIKFSLP